MEGELLNHGAVERRTIWRDPVQRHGSISIAGYIGDDRRGRNVLIRRKEVACEFRVGHRRARAIKHTRHKCRHSSIRVYRRDLRFKLVSECILGWIASSVWIHQAPNSERGPLRHQSTVECAVGPELLIAPAYPIELCERVGRAAPGH